MVVYNNCSCGFFIFQKETIFNVFLFSLPVDGSGSAHSQAGKMSLFLWPLPCSHPVQHSKNTWQMYKIILSLPKQCETWDAPKPPSPLPGSPFSFSAVLWDIYKHFDSFLPLYHLRWMLSCQIIHRAALTLYGCSLKSPACWHVCV